MKAKVSVVVPVYNAEKHLKNSFGSILGQDYQNMEIIAVNDGSRDKSLDILKEIAKSDSRVKVVDKLNGGPGDARNVALEHVTGDFVVFADSDDTLPEGVISLMLSKIGEHDVLIGNFNMKAKEACSERGLIKEEKSLNAGEFYEAYVKYPGSFYYSALWNKLYRSDIIFNNKLRFNAGITWGEDFIFNVHYYKHIKSAKILPVPVYNHILNLVGQTWTTLHRLPENIGIKRLLYRELKKMYKEKGLYKQYRPYVTRYIFNVTVLD
ncbi:MAG: glycosyltransferase family 2 protein [Eubacteriales bacterium]|nr:glycosyltransferase family 2 protein [Eubacteriales bacterium]